jgi:hypothetical protein
MKKISLIVSLFFLVGLSTSIIAQTQSGTFFFDGNTSGYTLNANEGLRSVEMEVSFEKGYDVKPEVILSVTLIDAVRETKMRYSVEAKSVSRDGFVIKVSVWGDTQLNSIGGFWVAVTE